MNDIEKAIAETCGHCIYEHGTHACRNAVCPRRIYVDALREKAVRDNPQPLTLEQLRERIGKPVWVMHKDGSGGRWGIVNEYEHPHGLCADYELGSAMWFDDFVGTIAYDYPPTEVHHER